MNPGVILTFIVIIGIPLLGVLILIALSMVRDNHQAALPSGTVCLIPSRMLWLLHVLGWSMLGGGGLVVLVLMASQAVRIAGQQFQTDDLVPVIIGTLGGALVAAAGVFQIAVALALSKPLSAYDQSRLQHNLTALRIIGWSFIALPLMFVGLIFIFVPILFGLAGLSTWTHHRRAEQVNLLWLLAIAVEKDMPLAEEIEAYADSQAGLRRRKTQELAERLREGISLPRALEELPGLVPRSAVLAVYAGAENGTLAQTLREAAARHASSLDSSPVISSVSGFLFYCCSILVITQAIVGFQIYYIVPKFKRIFDGFGVEFPLVTRLLLRISDAITEYFYLSMPLLSIPAILLVLLGVTYCIGWANLRHPILTRWFPRTDSPWILRILAQTVAAGRPLIDGIRTLSLRHHRVPIRVRLDQTVERVADGEEPWHALEAVGLINGREVAVITAAQRAGNLPWALNQVADHIEHRQAMRVAALFELARPVVIVGTGAVVAFVCLAFFSPLVQLLNNLS